MQKDVERSSAFRHSGPHASMAAGMAGPMEVCQPYPVAFTEASESFVSPEKKGLEMACERAEDELAAMKDVLFQIRSATLRQPNMFSRRNFPLLTN